MPFAVVTPPGGGRPVGPAPGPAGRGSVPLMDRGAATIVIVDDASEVRALVRTRLRLSGRLEVVGEGGDGAEAVALARKHRPALMLLDVSMPGMDGLEALPQVLAVSPTTRVVVYTGFEERGLAERARQLGAAAFLEKSTPVDSLVDRLLAVLGADVAADRLTRVSGAGTEPAGVRSDVSSGDQGVLDEHLERFREVFEEAAIGMATMTLAGRIVRANRALARLLGSSVEDLVGVDYGSLGDELSERVATALEEIGRTPLGVVQLEHEVSGAPRHRLVRSTLAPVRDSTGRALYVFLQVQDVTAERAAFDELRQSEERFRLLVSAVEDYAIFMLDPVGHIVSWNAGAQRSKGYLAEEIIGRHFRIFYPPEVQARQHPEHELQLALRDGHYEEEGWRVRKDGSRFWANVVITAVFNPAGEHIGFSKVTRDSSERRRLEQDREQAVQALAAANADLETLNARLQQVAADQSEFLAVTAHELRTPIGVLSGSAEMLARHRAKLTDEERDELFDAMASSTGRLRRLLADLLTASRLQTSALEMHSAAVLVRDVLADAVATVHLTHPHAEIVVEQSSDLAVMADRDRLAQALDNLLSNALRHGTPPVRVAADADSDWVDIRVSDQGPGVAPAVHPRLFERFATGQHKGGTGLGLFIVRELARAHGGDAFYEPASPGTPSGMFVIRVPRVRADPDE